MPPPRLRSLPASLPRLGQVVAPHTTGAGPGFARNDGRSSTARGYGADWRRVRAGVLAEEPLCRLCHAAGRVAAATEVDHIEPFHGLADPLRLAPTNLRPLCTPCHRSRTGRQARGLGE